MRTTQKILTVAAALVVAFSFGGPASADCGANPGVIASQGALGLSQVFTTAFAADPSFFYGAYGATTYCGAYNGCTPVVNPAATFWLQGAGDPVVGLGQDSGSFDLIAGGGLQFPAFPSYGYYAGAELNTSWQPGTDGCTEGGGCMCMLLTDNIGGETYYAILAAQSDPTLVTTFEQGGVDGSGLLNAPIIMTSITSPAITAAVRQGFDVDLTVSTAVQGGVYNKDGCDCSAIGFKVLQQIVPRGSQPPSDQSTGWVEPPLAPSVGGGAQNAMAQPLGSSITIRSTCGPADQDVYLSTELFFDSGFGTTLVSRNSSRVECGTTLADPDDKPRGTRPRIDGQRPTPRRR